MQIITNTLDTYTYHELADILHSYNNTAAVSDFLFFDIETTGFSARNSMCYLIGCVSLNNENFIIKQFFAENPSDCDDEKKMLTEFMHFASGFKYIVHFNGDVFDIPYLKERMYINGLAEHQFPESIVTITNNTAGGQPVSMQNLKEVRAIADKYGKPVVFDSARFAENAYFIKTREEGYKDKTIKEITKEMFALADGMTMSAKKDGIVNMGGFIATKRQDWYEGAKGYCVQFEGYLTYGGMNGRDMNALAIGLDENTEFDNLQTRIHQVEYLASLLDEYGIPYQRPAGGHAIFVDAPKVLTHVPKEEFPAQTLTIELYLEAGIRGCEIGYLLADRDPITRENRFNGLDLLRLAIPRRVYTDNHMAVIAAALKNVFDRRMQITHGVRIAWEAPLMRHFTVQLERITD